METKLNGLQEKSEINEQKNSKTYNHNDNGSFTSSARAILSSVGCCLELKKNILFSFLLEPILRGTLGFSLFTVLVIFECGFSVFTLEISGFSVLVSIAVFGFSLL